MSPRPLANVLSSEEQDVDEVWNWYELQRALIGEEKSRVLDAFALGASPIASRYFGRTAAVSRGCVTGPLPFFLIRLLRVRGLLPRWR